MVDHFLEIQKEYLRKVWLRPFRDLEQSLPARLEGDYFCFQAFGEACQLFPQEILLGGQRVSGPEGILIAMYANYVVPEEVQLKPLRSFKQFPKSMAYQGAFSANAERILIPYVSEIRLRQEELVSRFSGHINSDPPFGDFSFTLYPLPKIGLYYIFYLPDEEFSGNVSCLFSSNASHFLPLDGLADTAEYTARKIIQIISKK